MELIITAKNTKLSPEVRERINLKLGKLSRHLTNLTEANVEVDEEMTRSPEQRFVVEVTMVAGSTILRGEERGETLVAAIDKVAETMVRQVEHFKGRVYDRKRRGPSAIRTTAPAGAASEEETVPPAIVRVKRFPLKPMPVEEAIDQMELLGHDFFLFLSNEGVVNLVYRRNDGNYGLIEPQY